MSSSHRFLPPPLQELLGFSTKIRNSQREWPYSTLWGCLPSLPCLVTLGVLQKLCWMWTQTKVFSILFYSSVALEDCTGIVHTNQWIITKKTSSNTYGPWKNVFHQDEGEFTSRPHLSWDSFVKTVVHSAPEKKNLKQQLKKFLSNEAAAIQMPPKEKCFLWKVCFHHFINFSRKAYSIPPEKCSHPAVHWNNSVAKTLQAVAA